VIYGTEDFPFITQPSESVYVALTRVGVECRRIAIPGTGHEFRGPQGYQPEAAEQASREIVAWFEETLAAR
jgi:dipeptidyl aminopeptidase/acylaminoacyl peptidase